MKKIISSAWELVKFAIITLAIVIPVRTFIAEPFIVSGQSMYPSFDNGQYLIVDALSYHLRSPKRGEVVVFRYPRDPSKFFIKRIVGLPNETVDIRNNQVYVTSGSNPEQVILEPYITSQRLNDLQTKLGASEYFVLGDNRSMSLDSRAWGAVPADNLKGRVLLRLFPLTTIGLLPANAAQ